MSTTLSIAIPHDRQVVLRKVLEWAATDKEFDWIKLELNSMGLTTADRVTWYGVMRSAAVWGCFITTVKDRDIARSISFDIQNRLDKLPPEPIAEVVGVADERPRQKSLF